MNAPCEPLLVELSWPAKELSPNARVHHMVKHRYAKAAKIESGWATRIAKPMNFGGDRFDVHIRAYPPEAWRTGDADNLIAQCKNFIDGIASALGVNDRQFNAPTVEFGDRTQRGKIVIVLRPVTGDAG